MRRRRADKAYGIGNQIPMLFGRQGGAAGDRRNPQYTGISGALQGQLAAIVTRRAMAPPRDKCPAT